MAQISSREGLGMLLPLLWDLIHGLVFRKPSKQHFPGAL